MGNNQGLYLGKELKPGAKELGARLELDPADLLTHGLIVGMTGSGKTGPRHRPHRGGAAPGRSGPRHRPEGRPRQPAAALRRPRRRVVRAVDRRRGRAARGEERRGRGGRGGGQLDRRASPSGASAPPTSPPCKQAHDAVIYTPGSTRGRPPERPPVARGAVGALRLAPAEDLRDEIAGIVAGLLGLLQIDADPLQSRESILLSNLIESVVARGQGPDPRVPDHGGRRPALRQARRPAPRERLSRARSARG